MLDVDQFNLEHLRVEVVGNFIEVEGQQEMINDKLGSISRWMKRKYKVPPDVKLDTVNSVMRNKVTIAINAERNLVSCRFYKITGLEIAFTYTSHNSWVTERFFGVKF